MDSRPALGPWTLDRRDAVAAARLAALGADFSFLEAAEPRVARQKNVLIWCLPTGRTLRCLLDSGAELDLLDSSLALAEGFPRRRLQDPLHLHLGTAGKTDSLDEYCVVNFMSGSLSLRNRPFFLGDVAGYDAILGLPFIEDTGVRVGSGTISCHPTLA